MDISESRGQNAAPASTDGALHADNAASDTDSFVTCPQIGTDYAPATTPAASNEPSERGSLIISEPLPPRRPSTASSRTSPASARGPDHRPPASPDSPHSHPGQPRPRPPANPNARRRPSASASSHRPLRTHHEARESASCPADEDDAPTTWEPLLTFARASSKRRAAPPPARDHASPDPGPASRPRSPLAPNAHGRPASGSAASARRGPAAWPAQHVADAGPSAGLAAPAGGSLLWRGKAAAEVLALREGHGGGGGRGTGSAKGLWSGRYRGGKAPLLEIAVNGSGETA